MDMKIISVNGTKVDIPIYHFDLIGEGVVWKCVTPGWESSNYWFKVKGEAHVKGTSIEGLNLSANDRTKVINFCLENGIKEFDYYFLE